MPSPQAWLRFLGVALLVAAWSGLSALYPPIIVPSPLEVAQALARMAATGVLWRELGQTVGRLLVTYGLSALLGIGLGLLAGRFGAIDALVRPAISVAAGAPPISWIALALIWFGTGGLAPALAALLLALPVIFVATVEGVRALDHDLLAMARVFGLTGRRLVREFYLPALAPHLLSGLTVAAALTVRVGIMGEFLTGNGGVGSAMFLARTHLDTPQVVAWVVVALALLSGAEGLLLNPLRRRVAAWREEGK